MPKIYTARYLNPRLAEPEKAGIVPVRVSMREPIVPLPYDLEETAETLLPGRDMVGEWPNISPAYWRLLDARGLGPVTSELAGISKRRNRCPLVLLDHEDVTKGDRSLRMVFSAWWKEGTGREVLELADDGRALRFDALPRRTRPKKPKIWRQDRRWRDDDALELSWPLTEEDVRRWIQRRHWQRARSRSNPHAYTVRSWGSDEAFWLVVMHMREYGQQEEWRGDTYTYYVAGGFKHWTMGADLMSTILINRKPVGQDEGDEETEERSGGGPQPDLFRALPGEERA